VVSSSSSVLRSEFAESVRRSYTSKFSVDRYGKLICEEDGTCELKVLFEVCYEDCDR
jgi:hypothetical protein